MLRRNALLLPFLLALAVACASGSRQLLPMPSQDVVVSDPGLCRVYLARDGQVRGAIRSLTVYDGPREVGTIGRAEYLCWERRPERGLLRLVYDAGQLGGEYEGLFDLEPRPGGVYYVAVAIEGLPDDPQDTSLRKPRGRLLSTEEGLALLADRSPARVR